MKITNEETDSAIKQTLETIEREKSELKTRICILDNKKELIQKKCTHNHVSATYFSSFSRVMPCIEYTCQVCGKVWNKVGQNDELEKKEAKGRELSIAMNETFFHRVQWEENK